MKNVLKMLLIVMFVTLSALAFSPRPKSNFNAEIPLAENVSTAPRDLFLRNCARCHGADGKSQTRLGETFGATDLTVKKNSVQRNIRVITRGIGGMPAFGRKLKKTDIAALAAYVRGL